MAKKSKFKVLAEALTSGKMGQLKMPTERVEHRRLSVDEIKQFIKEEFGNAKDIAKVKADQSPKGWGDAELVKQIDWIKALDLKEYFHLKKEVDSSEPNMELADDYNSKISEMDDYDDMADEPADTYYSSAKGQMIDKARADQEMRKHGNKPGTPEWAEYEKMFGNKPQIDAQQLLQFLGY